MITLSGCHRPSELLGLFLVASRRCNAGGFQEFLRAHLLVGLQELLVRLVEGRTMG